MRALALDTRPVVNLHGSVAEVALLTFSPWGGFILATCRIALPARLLALRKDVRVGYQSRIRY